MDISFIQYLEADASVMKPHATRTIGKAVIHRLSMYRSQIDLAEIDPWKDAKDRSQSF